MKPALSLLPLALLALLAAASRPAAATTESDPRAVALLRTVDDLWRGEASHEVMSMHIKTAHYERSLELEAWSKGKYKTLVSILKPAKDAGTMTLKNMDAIYTYLPRTDRTIKLNAGMMGGSWMGSHFTNDDLVKGSRLSEDYVSSISFEGKRDGKDVIELTLLPRPDAAVVWGKIVTLLDAADKMPLLSTYYDEDLKVARTMSFGAIKDFGQRKAPSSMRLVPADLPGESTELDYETLQLDAGVTDDTFSLARLQRRGR